MSATGPWVGTTAGASPWADALALAARIVRGVLFALLPLYAASGLHFIQPHERAVVRLFGRVRGDTWGPGAHWTLPRPFAEVIRLEAARPRPLTIGTPPIAEDARRADEELWRDGVLTARANLIRSRWTAWYLIEDPVMWVTAAQSPTAVISNELKAAVVRATAGMELDAVLRTRIETLRGRIEEEVARRVAARRIGVRIERVEAVELGPPAAVAAAFDDVTRAAQERASRVEEARRSAARLVHEAAAEAARRRAAAAAARDRELAAIRADAAVFRQLLPRVKENREVVLTALWQDSVRRALAAVAEIYVLRPRTDGSQELRLWLAPELPGAEDHADVP
ncbi:MAG: SPFH domain-containing protein [Kiritimatiellae bacterium]|nr:SPFH domain-containing protein [Kiritimatiellia bacterium]